MAGKTKTAVKPAPRLYLLPWIRLAIALAVGWAAFALIPPSYGTSVRLSWAWDGGVLALIAMIMVMMVRSTTDHMRERAARQDLGRSVILVAIVAGALASMVALVAVQKALKGGGAAAILPLATIVATILLSWFLVHIVFTLHYAHAYYGPATDETDEDGLVGGLEFPSKDRPDYWDFMYFSFVVGMTCQVSDVQISGRMLRRLALFHGIVSFFFNTIILALTINILASAI